jgi:hypothetical protein
VTDVNTALPLTPNRTQTAGSRDGAAARQECHQQLRVENGRPEPGPKDHWHHHESARTQAAVPNGNVACAELGLDSEGGRDGPGTVHTP